MHVEIVKDHAGLAALRPAWDRLAQGAGHPFAAWAWADAWWRHLQPRGRGRHELHVLVAREGGAVVGILPLFRTTWLPWLAGGVSFLRPLGADRNVTELKTALLAPGRERDAIARFDAFLHEEARGWDFVQWPDIPAAVADEITMVRRQVGPLETFRVPLAASWDELKSTRKRNVKESIRKCYNAPARDGVALDFVALDTPETVAAHLQAFYDLHGRRAAAADGPAHPDYFQPPEHRALLEAAVRAEGAARPRLFLVKHGETIVAARLGFETGDTLYLYYSGYDPAYAAYSVPTRLVCEAMQDAIRRGLRHVHLSTGRDASKTRWSPEETAHLRPLCVRRRLRARLLHRAFERARALRQRAAHAELAAAPAVGNV